MDWGQFFDKFGLPGLILVGLYSLARFGIGAWRAIELERIKVQDKQADAHVAALTSLSGKIDNHHTNDLQSHAEMHEDLGALHAKLDVLADLTPVRPPKQHGPFGARPARAETKPGGGG